MLMLANLPSSVYPASMHSALAVLLRQSFDGVGVLRYWYVILVGTQVPILCMMVVTIVLCWK
jgi:hypothetical protein